MRAQRIAPVLLCAALGACAQQPAKDPLQYTKKLAAEGHATLYHNGAFEIPMTTIHIIPPGPDAWDLAFEMAGMRARQSLQESWKHALESGGIARAGVDKSVQVAHSIRQGTDEAVKDVHGVTRFGMGLAGSAPGITRDRLGASITYAKQVNDDVSESGKNIARDAWAAGKEMSGDTTDLSARLGGGTLALAGSTSKASLAAAREDYAALKRYIKGYAAVPGKLGQRIDSVKEGASLAKFVDAFQQSNEWRAEQSGRMRGIMGDTAANYTKDAAAPFTAAKKEITEGNHDTGYSLALAKSLAWVAQGVLWDATIKPVGKETGAFLGFVTANGVAFPALFTMKEGVAVADVAVQVTWNAAAGAYDVTAPTAGAALAGMFGAVELVGGQALAGSELGGGAVAAGGTFVAGQAVAGTTALGGYAAGKTVQYVGAPISTIGVGAGGIAAGVATGAGAAVGGAGVAAAGFTGEVATKIGGNLAAGTAALGGSVASVGAGAAVGTYELSRAVVVPTGYELGSGVVLGYGTLSQLGAHTILLAGDASYMVASLEGPKWVLYAVTGKLDNGENLPPGALLDLKAMQQAGETFVAVPVDAGEMQRVVDGLPGQLPVRVPAEAAPH